jgi:peptidyl-prolyl cis-trans isomerase A (cyclophilin A)
MIRRRSTLVLGSAWLVSGAAPDAADVQIVLRTEAGEVTIALYPKQAPLSCAAFLACVDARLYDQGRFTRVVRPQNDRGSPKINVVQGAAAKDAPPQKPVAHEPTGLTGLRHRDGTISLPRDAPGTATGDEFFICIGDNPGLDQGGTRNKDLAGYAAFGQVLSGMEIVRAIWRMDASGPSDDAYTRDQMLLHPVPILSVRRA